MNRPGEGERHARENCAVSLCAVLVVALGVLLFVCRCAARGEIPDYERAQINAVRVGWGLDTLRR